MSMRRPTLGRPRPHRPLFVLYTLIVGHSHGRTSLTDDNFFKEVVLSGRWSFVKFYSPSCGHCKRLRPAWDALAVEFAGSPAVLIAEVDCVGGGFSLCEKLGVQSYPSLKHFEPGSFTALDYTGERDLPALRQFASSELGPQCTASTLEKCSAQKRTLLESYMRMSPAKRAAKVAKLRNSVQRAEEEHLSMRRDLQAHATGKWDASKAKLEELKASVAEQVKLIRAADTPEQQAEWQRQDAVAKETRRERERQKQLAARKRVEGERARKEQHEGRSRDKSEL